MVKNKITTIKIQEEIKERLEGLKEYERETYNDVLKKVLNIINITIRSPVSGARIFRGIKRKKLGKERMIYRQEMARVRPQREAVQVSAERREMGE